MNPEYMNLGAETYPVQMSGLELELFFTLSAEDRAFVLSRRGALNRIGLALQIGLLKMTGGTTSPTRTVPATVLRHIAEQLGLEAPEIASIKSLYRRRSTRFEHRSLCAQHLGFRAIREGGRAGLVKYLNEETVAVLDVDELLRKARCWLHARRYFMLAKRDLRAFVRRAIVRREAQLFNAVTCSVGDLHESWVPALAAKLDDRTARIDWLRAGPRRKSIPELEEQGEKIVFLRTLGANDIRLDGLPDATVAMYARRVALRKPSMLHRRKEPGRTLEIACFLKRQLQRSTDGSIDLFNHLVNDLVRQSRDRAIERVAQSATGLGKLVVDLQAITADETLSAEEIRLRLSQLISPYTETGTTVLSRATATRLELSKRSVDTLRLLEILSKMDLEVPHDHSVSSAIRVLEQAKRPGARRLPLGTPNVFGTPWTTLVQNDDRTAAFASWCAATTLLLKRSLRNGSVSISHSKDYRNPERHLIPRTLWEKDRGRFTRNLIREKSSERFVRRIEMGLKSGLRALAVSVAEGGVRIRDGHISLRRNTPIEVDQEVLETRNRMISLLGSAQLPDVIIETDRLTGFSRALLGRSPHSQREAVILYSALLGLGSDLEAADVERMVDGVSADSVGLMMQRLEDSGRLREANQAVVRFTSGLNVAQVWGPGLDASADMMSLDAAKTLWSARSDPRRRVASMGTYTHVLDQWSLIYDQPIVLNQRQAGVALEGALRHEDADLERIAVDTHGMTHFSIALGKILGFDLCPRLARLSERKLYVFRDTVVPPELEPVVSRTLSRRAIATGWDGLLRLAASTQNGWCSAVWAVERHSSAATGTPVYKSGETLGKLLRSVFLCDYLGKPAVRGEIQKLLNQSESSHTLQRAIYNGPIKARRGRTREQMAAISGALTLLSNIVIAWNANGFDRILSDPGFDRPRDHIRHIAPIAHRHINLRGIFFFGLEKESSTRNHLAEKQNATSDTA